MHAAKLAKSDRLKRVARLLKTRKIFSTRDIIVAAQVCAVNSIISELRANGMNIKCRRIRNVWLYQLSRDKVA